MDPNRITYFAETDARNKRDRFGIKAQDRTKHMYVIGKTGMGKSTLLENMIIQDIRAGEGLAFIDPHGASAEKILDFIPEERIGDVMYFAPFDLENPIAFNVMEDVGYDKRHLVVSGLMSAFKKIWADQWSSRMEYILTNTLLALLEYPNSTMLGINKMYADKAYRKKVVENIKDPLVRSFWEEEFAKFTDSYSREATPAIQNKVGQFTGNPLVRNIIGQSKSSFDLRQIIDNKKILICNLSKGLVGEVNANLLGSMLITKLYLAAMGRADVSEVEREKLPNFYFYVDEFQSFANESFADILSEARKYKLNLTLAHQYIEQMSDEVRAAVFGNVGTMVTFRVGAYDADVLEKEFAPQFYAQDLVNLGFTQIYLKLMIDGVSSKPFSATTLPPLDEPLVSFRKQAVEESQKVFGRPRKDVEEEIAKLHAPPPKPGTSTRDEKRREPRREGHTPQKSENRLQQGGGRSATREPRERTEAPRVERTTVQIEESKHKEQLTAIAAQIGTVEQSHAPPKDSTVENRPPGDIKDDRKPQTQGPQKIISQQRRKDTKGPTEESRASLRSALAGVLSKEGDARDVPQQADTKKEDTTQKKTRENQETVRESSTPNNKQSNATEEVPEDVLKKMLDVEE